MLKLTTIYLNALINLLLRMDCTTIRNIPGIKLPSPPRLHLKHTKLVGILSMFNFNNKLKSYKKCTAPPTKCYKWFKIHGTAFGIRFVCEAL